MADIDDYDAGAALTAYYPSKTERRPARLWATEHFIQTMADLGLCEVFYGAGTDPTGLSGYALTKLWLQVSSGITDAPGTLRAYAGTGDPTLVASWPELTMQGFRSYISAAPYEITLYRSTQTALVGPTAATYGNPGVTGVTASYIQLYCAILNRPLQRVFWRVVWDPDCSTGSTGVRLVHADSGPSNITEIIAQTASGTGSVRNDGFNITDDINSLIAGTVDKQIGHQAIGNGSDAAKIYGSWLEVVA